VGANVRPSGAWFSVARSPRPPVRLARNASCDADHSMARTQRLSSPFLITLGGKAIGRKRDVNVPYRKRTPSSARLRSVATSFMRGSRFAGHAEAWQPFLHLSTGEQVWDLYRNGHAVDVDGLLASRSRMNVENETDEARIRCPNKNGTASVDRVEDPAHFVRYPGKLKLFEELIHRQVSRGGLLLCPPFQRWCSRPQRKRAE
jgi:hypothetical protein